jgi:hypothetical protein
MSSFNPNHHPILDTPPHEFVRMANAKGIKLAKGVGYLNPTRTCGCVGGVAAHLADLKYDRLAIAECLGLRSEEAGGIMGGFDNMRPWLGCDLYATGYAWGSAVRAAALEIQGDLEPTPLVKGATA